jgi:hypothetical protein
MGIMSNKVTRRVALGSIAGGLAGGAAVIHALKGRYSVRLREGNPDFEKGWKDYALGFDVSVEKEKDGPSVSVSVLDYRPQVGEKFRARYFYASSYSDLWPNEWHNGIPRCYTPLDGTLTVERPVLGDRPAILIDVRKAVTKHAARSSEQRPGGTYLVASANDGLTYFQVNAGKQLQVPVTKVPSSCAGLAAGVLYNFHYPKDEALAPGAAWTIPATPQQFIPRPCKLIDFALLAGRKTVHVLSEEHFNNQEYRQYLVQLAQCRKKAGEPSSQIDEELKYGLESAADSRTTWSQRLEAYIDMKTGLVWRLESGGLLHTGPDSHSNLCVMQLSDA